VIGLILGNGTHPGVDSQGEELSIAIVETSQVPESAGEWQYALCSSSHSNLATACSSVVSTWVTIGDVSESHALILPNTARIRFIRKAIEFDGAVWMRVKLWDGNQDGYLSPEDNLVRTRDPHFNFTVPFSSISPYSEDTTLITVLVQPLISPPTFSTLTSLQFLKYKKMYCLWKTVATQLQKLWVQFNCLISEYYQKTELKVSSCSGG